MKTNLSARIRIFGCLVLCLSTLSLANAEQDRLVRAFLGITSIPVRFQLTKGQEYGYFAIAKFKGGKFLGYATVQAPVEYLKLADRPKFEAELGWAFKDGSMQYILVTPKGTQGFEKDEFFETLLMGRYLAYDQLPQKRHGPYQVLGFAVGGKGKEVKASHGESVEEYIRNDWNVVAFLACLFESEKKATDFSKDPSALDVK